MSLKIKIDTAAIAAQFKELSIEVQQDLTKAVELLARSAQAHIVGNTDNLSPPNQLKYKKSLDLNEVAPGVWVISLDEKAMYIEEGIEPNKDMKPDLLKNARETSKAGYKYRSIPFDMGKTPSTSTGYEQNLVDRVKLELKRINKTRVRNGESKIPYKKIEKNHDGTPKLGLLHKFNFGGEIPGRGNTPVLKGVSIYQSMKNGNVRRDILTFRTVSEGPASANKWFHPGYEAKKFFEKAEQFATEKWEQSILPEVLEKWKV